MHFKVMSCSVNNIIWILITYIGYMTFYATLYVYVKGSAVFVMQWLYVCIGMNVKDTKMSVLHCTYYVFSFMLL